MIGFGEFEKIRGNGCCPSQHPGNGLDEVRITTNTPSLHSVSRSRYESLRMLLHCWCKLNCKFTWRHTEQSNAWRLRRVVSVTPRPRLPPGRGPLYGLRIGYKAEWAPEWVRTRKL